MTVYLLIPIFYTAYTFEIHLFLQNNINVVSHPNDLLT